MFSAELSVEGKLRKSDGSYRIWVERGPASSGHLFSPPGRVQNAAAPEPLACRNAGYQISSIFMTDRTTTAYAENSLRLTRLGPSESASSVAGRLWSPQLRGKWQCRKPLMMVRSEKVGSAIPNAQPRMAWIRIIAATITSSQTTAETSRLMRRRFENTVRQRIRTVGRAITNWGDNEKEKHPSSGLGTRSSSFMEEKKKKKGRRNQTLCAI